MIPSAFEYHRATTVDEAINLLKMHGAEAKLLAGGHSLLPAMKLRLSAPGNLIDIGHISELKYIRDDGGLIAIGATATHDMIASSTEVQAKAPALAKTAGLIGDLQVRNKGTIGGSLAHADPAADYPAYLLAADAEMVVKGPNGQRTIAAADFFQDVYVTNLQDDEILTEVRVPALSTKTGSSYQKFEQPASRFAIVGCAAIVTKDNGACSRVRVAFTGVSNSVFRDSGVEDALTGQAPSEAHIAAAAEKAAAGVVVLSDHFASEDYRRHLAGVYAKRALTEAAGLAG
ncbi:MAG: FAD binding domain-containing protein [bacterium]